MSRIIIASAAAFETDALVVNLEKAGVPFTRIFTGIGLTQTSMTCARLADLVFGRHVFFVCTGGVIDAEPIMRIYAARRVYLAPYDIRHGTSELVGQFDPDMTLNGDDLGCSQIDVAGSLGVSVQTDRTDNQDHLIETMELYGVARAWRHHAKSLSAFVTTTNATGPKAREQWRDNFKKAAQLTAEQLTPKIVSFMTKNEGGS